MATTSLLTTYTDSSGKTQQKTVTNVNPDATNEVLATAMQKLVGMTDNVYGTTYRIDKTNCDTEEGDGGKPEPTLTFSPATISISQLDGQTVGASQVTYSGDAEHLYFTLPNSDKISITDGGGGYLALYAQNASSWKAGVQVTVYAPETDNYKAATATLTFTA